MIASESTANAPLAILTMVLLLQCSELCLVAAVVEVTRFDIREVITTAIESDCR